MKFLRDVSVVILLAVMTTSGCSTYNSVQLRKENINSSYTYYKLDPPLYAGDNIKYTLKNGNKGEMTLASVDPHSLVGDHGQVIALSDLTSLERKDISKGKTAAAVGGGVATTTIVILGIMVVGAAAAIAAF